MLGVADQVKAEGRGYGRKMTMMIDQKLRMSQRATVWVERQARYGEKERDEGLRLWDRRRSIRRYIGRKRMGRRWRLEGSGVDKCDMDWCPLLDAGMLSLLPQVRVGKMEIPLNLAGRCTVLKKGHTGTKSRSLLKINFGVALQLGLSFFYSIVIDCHRFL